MAYLVNYIHARVVNECGELCFYQIEVIEYDLLKSPAFRFRDRVHAELFDYLLALLFGYKNGGSHMIVVFLDTCSTSAGLLPHAALAGAKRCYFLPMLAF